MKVQLCSKKIVPDAIVAWHEHGPEVDIVVDFKNLPFAPGSVEKLYAFHVLEHLFPNETVATLKNWKSRVAAGGTMSLVNDDFEFVCRSFVGGDVSISQVNSDFTHPTYFTRDNIVDMLTSAGVDAGSVVIWFADVTGEFPKAEHELVVAAKL